MHYSPQVTLVEALLDCLLLAFFLHHSWRYDKWECLKVWKIRSNREVFRRLMLWGFAIGLPLNIAKTTLAAVIKYQVGFLPISEGGSPVPYTLWTPKQQSFIKPISILDSILWFNLLTVHWEETCFWFFLTHNKANSKPWFQSIWFKTFLIGTALTAVLITAVTVVYINNPLKLEAVAYCVFGGITFFQVGCFLYIFSIFPKFLSQLYGVSKTSEVLSKLLSFHEINKIRVFVRTIFAIVITIDAVDGLTERQIINHKLPIVDVLLMTSVITAAIGSLTTLLVFLPRNPLKERGLRLKAEAFIVEPAIAQSSGIQVPISVEKSYEITDTRGRTLREPTQRLDKTDEHPADDSEPEEDGDDDAIKLKTLQQPEAPPFTTTIQFISETTTTRRYTNKKDRKNLPAALKYYSSPIDIVEENGGTSSEDAV